ncbi:MAG TPA: hemerythrin domain-containing protein, partial [Actinopolymorphaceae bacterium]
MNERTSSRDDSAPADRPAGVEARPAEADHQAAEAVARHHREMVTVLAERVEAIVGAVDRDDSAAAERARAALTRWCDDELLPHTAAEERALYPMAREDPAGRLLVEG